MRTFIAIELSEEQKNKLATLQNEIKKAGMDAKIVEKETLHITLKFLGEINLNELEIVKESLKEAVKDTKKFSFIIKEVGAFPSIAKPRVIWAGIENGRDELISLATKVSEKVIVKEFDSKPFSAHITVARLRSEKHIAALPEIIKNFEEFDFGETTVNEVKIKESKLSPEGPDYTDVFTSALW